MIKSMTGFSRVKAVENKREYQVEIKSVNHKYSDIGIKSSRQLSYLEDEIKKNIASRIKRGKIDIYISLEDYNNDEKNITINKDTARVYIQNLKQIAHEEQLSDNINLIDIIKLPDVLVIKNKENEEEIKRETLKLINKAIDELIEMRLIEGEKISTDLLKRIDDLEMKISEISELSTGLIAEYVVKLENRIKELLKTDDIDKARLAQETVMFADKCSVEEEITRLKSHIYQFKNLIFSNEAVGKKLDFIVQEINRETNTIGSKANCLDITNRVIDMKTQIENIREQIQNIE